MSQLGSENLSLYSTVVLLYKSADFWNILEGSGSFWKFSSSLSGNISMGRHGVKTMACQESGLPDPQRELTGAAALQVSGVSGRSPSWLGMSLCLDEGEFLSE